MSKNEKANGQMLKSKRLIREIAGYALALVVVGYIGNLWMTREQVSGKPPELVGQLIEPGVGRRDGLLDLAAYDKPMLLYFFAEWCPICKLQNPVISKLARDYPVVGVAMRSGDGQQVRAWLEQRGLDLPVVNDPQGRISRTYGVNGVPAAFIIGPDGQIASSTRGYATEAGLRSRLWLAGHSQSASSVRE